MKTEGIKPNYAELARMHKCDYRTVKKYNEGYIGKPISRDKESKLDKYKEDIKIKLDLPESTVKGTFQYFKEKDVTIGNYSNFYKYVIKNNLKGKAIINFTLDMKLNLGSNYNLIGREDIKLFNKYGEIFEFNIFFINIRS